MTQDPTCDPKLRSFVEIDPDSHFPIQNLPYGVFSPTTQEPPRVGVRIGEFVWVASDVTVMRGVTIGDHAVVGARSVVLRDVPAHTLAFGTPAEARGAVGDRSSVT